MTKEAYVSGIDKSMIKHHERRRNKNQDDKCQHANLIELDDDKEVCLDCNKVFVDHNVSYLEDSQ